MRIINGKSFRWTDRLGETHDMNYVHEVQFCPSHVVFWREEHGQKVMMKAIHNDNVRKIEPLEDSINPITPGLPSS